MSSRFGRNDEFGERGSDCDALRHELGRAPVPQNDECLGLEYARNRVRILFEAVMASDSTGVPCLVDGCSFAVVWGENGTRLAGSCAIRNIDDDR